MKLSIITICYNEPNLEKTCESIVNQTWQDFEWIVVDGGSNQETQEIWDKYKYRIDKFTSEPDDGRYNAMNKGIKLASGEYINFLNAGDYYSGNNSLLNIIGECTSDIVYSDLKVIDTDNTERIWEVSKKIDNEFLIIGTLPHPSSFIKKELFKKYGGYNESYKIVSDWEKWIIFLIVNKCSYKHINSVCSVFNRNGISSTNIKLCQQERDDVLKKYFTEEQINKFLERKDKYSFIEQIFSIKNSNNKIHKIITVLGIHIKIKRKVYKGE